jgi:hypothetical protein
MALEPDGRAETDGRRHHVGRARLSYKSAGAAPVRFGDGSGRRVGVAAAASRVVDFAGASRVASAIDALTLIGASRRSTCVRFDGGRHEERR